MNKFRIENLARWVSNLFNPFMLLGPVHISIFLITGNIIDQFSKLAIIILLQQVLPVLLLLMFMRLKLISDFDITDRKERTEYFFVGLFLFLVSLVFTDVVDISNLITIALATSLFFVTIINWWWKISGHMAFDTVLFLGLISLYKPFVFLLLLIPAIAWSRIEQKKHTVWQTIAGTILGIIVFYVIKY